MIASVRAEVRRDTGEGPSNEGHPLRRARSWCALGHRREGSACDPYALPATCGHLSSGGNSFVASRVAPKPPSPPLSRPAASVGPLAKR